MTLTTRYLAATGFALIAAITATTFGFTLAGQAFTPAKGGDAATVAAASASEDASVDGPSSALLGTVREVGANAEAGVLGAPDSADRSWVEVVDAVNMRAGPSSSNPIIKVQLAGTQLQVDERQGPWVKVVDPDSGTEGWVFDEYVKRITPASRRADSGTTRFQ